MDTPEVAALYAPEEGRDAPDAAGLGAPGTLRGEDGTLACPSPVWNKR